MLIRIDGELPEGSTAKDLALTVLRTISARGALGHVVEYQGSAVDALSIEGRMTLCNLLRERSLRPPAASGGRSRLTKAPSTTAR